MRRASALALALGLFVVCAAPAFALDEPLSDPALEARAQSLAERLRCLVCQNQSIAESEADLAQDLRRLVRELDRLRESD